MAEAEEWEQFLVADQERQQLLREIKIDEAGLSEIESLTLRKEMTVLIELNRQLEQICMQQRSVFAGRLKQIRVGSKVSKAYSQ